MKPSASSLSFVRSACFLAILCALGLAGCQGSSSAGNEQAAPSVTIHWASSASTVAGYNIYRASPPEVPAKLNSEVVHETTYTDKAVEAGHAYSYFVTSVDAKGLESPPSQRIDVKVPATGVAAAFARFFARLRGNS